MAEKARETKGRGISGLLVSGCVSMAFFCFLYFFVSPLFAINDDVMIESVLSGSYLKPYPYSFYFSAELGWILAGLYRLLPVIPWFGLFYALCHFACMTSLLRFAWQKGKDLKARLLSAAFVILAMTAFCFSEFVLMHYTVLAALLGATGLFLFLTADGKENYWRCILYFLLSYLVRENVFFMLAPFIALAFIYLLIANGKESLRKTLIQGGTFGALFLVLFGINRMMPMNDEWKAYKNYNDVRTQVYDYLGIHSEEEALRQYEKDGVTPQDVAIVSSYNLALFDDGTGELPVLKAIEAYGEQVKQKPVPRLVWALKSYVHRMLLEKEDLPLNAIVLLAYAGLLLWYGVRKSWLRLMVLIGLGGYRSAFWVFLFYKGRYPERVVLSLYLLEIAALAAIFLRDVVREISQGGKGILVRRITLGVLAAALLFIGAWNVKDVRAQYRAQAMQNRSDDVLIQYVGERPDHFYFLDVYAIVGRTKKVFESTGNTYENYFWMGGWMTRHPLWLEKLRGLFNGEDNAKDALLAGNGTYLVLKEGTGAKKEEAEQWLGASLTLTDEVKGPDVTFLIYEVRQ